MPVPLLDLKRQYASLRPQVEARLLDVAGSQQFFLVPTVEEFEEAVRQLCGAG